MTWLSCDITNLTEAQVDALENAIQIFAIQNNIDISTNICGYDMSSESQEKPTV